MNSYANFVRLMWNEVQEKNPEDSFGDISRKIAQIWRTMSDIEKANYEGCSDSSDSSDSECGCVSC